MVNHFNWRKRETIHKNLWCEAIGWQSIFFLFVPIFERYVFGSLMTSIRITVMVASISFHPLSPPHHIAELGGFSRCEEMV